MDNDEAVLSCPHCGNKTPHVIKMQTSANEDVYDIDGEYVGSFDNYYYLTECKTCKNVCLFSDWEHDDNPGDLTKASLLYPSKRKIDEAIPQNIKRSYEEAKKVEKISPNAFTVLIRRSIELLCRDQKAKGNNLKDQISNLSLRGIIPATLVEMADTLRFIGNIGAHEIEFDFGKLETKAMDDFFLAVLEYVYVAPNKIKQFKESITKQTKE